MLVIQCEILEIKKVADSSLGFTKRGKMRKRVIRNWIPTNIPIKCSNQSDAIRILKNYLSSVFPKSLYLNPEKLFEKNVRNINFNNLF